jgi:putative hydrolase of the HAD superfamily
MICAIFFDLDGTLYDRDAAIIRMAEQQFDAFRPELGVDKTPFVERLIKLDDHGHNRTPRLHHALADELALGHDLGDRLEAFFRSNYPNECQISKDSLDTLTTLRSSGTKLGIITNGPTEWQSRKIACMGIASLFDTIVISESEGIKKPDRRIFERAMERCGTVAARSIFVGDHPQIDIQGAQHAGLIPVWKVMPYWRVPDNVLKVERLSELLPLVMQH